MANLKIAPKLFILFFVLIMPMSLPINVIGKDRTLYLDKLNLAREAVRKPDYPLALKLFKYIIRIAPHSSYANYALGRVYLIIPRDTKTKKGKIVKKKEIKNAIRHLFLSTKQDPGSARNYFYLAFAYYFGGYKDLSFHSFKKAVALDRKFYESYFNMAVIMEEQKMFTASKKYFELYLKRLKGEKVIEDFEDF